MKLSVIIIAKNEEDRIEKAITSVLDIASEIIVVDNNSADKTKTIAAALGAKVFTFSGEGFAAQRNFGLSKSSGEWIFYLDADEVVTKELRKSIVNVLEGKGSFVAYKIQRKNFYLGEHPWPQVETLERLFNKTSLKKWQGVLHESPIIEGDAGILDGFLFHYTHRNLAQMLEKTIEWSQQEAQLRYDANHPPMTWWRFPRVMCTAFYDSYVKQKGWKAGTVGLIESLYQSFSMFITYARLWELQKKKK